VQEYGYKDERAARGDIAKLRSMGFPIFVQHDRVSIARLGLEGLWEGTPIGDRLIRNVESKERLARRIVDFLYENGESIYRIILGSGTTMFEVTKEIIARRDQLGISNIYTTSLLVVREFVFHKMSPVDKPNIHMAQGMLNVHTGSLFSERGVKDLRGLRVDAVITSFYGLFYDEITTGQFHERSEMIANLRPHEKCKYVMIPLEWFKIGRRGSVIIEKEEGRGSLELLDCRKWRYVIITDPPNEQEMSKGRNPERRKILKYWHENGVEIIPREVVAGL
jgi:DeoR/GlpR family transcriptional regulator of sugar metabolism